MNNMRKLGAETSGESFPGFLGMDPTTPAAPSDFSPRNEQETPETSSTEQETPETGRTLQRFPTAREPLQDPGRGR